MSDINHTIHAYVDGDLIQYRFAIANQKKDGSVDFQKAQQDAENFIDKIQNTLFADKLTLVFSDRNNFRKHINRCYKSNRSGEKPKLLGQLNEHLSKSFTSTVYPFLEADDMLGIICTAKEPGEKKILVSWDKDMKTLPVEIYNPTTIEHFTVTPREAAQQFWTQCITGDTTDGYYGIPGVGPKGADPMVQHMLDMHSDADRLKYLLEQYAWRYLDQEYALRQCRMAYILRQGDLDVETGGIKLWNPTSESPTWFLQQDTD